MLMPNKTFPSRVIEIAKLREVAGIELSSFGQEVDFDSPIY